MEAVADSITDALAGLTARLPQIALALVVLAAFVGLGKLIGRGVGLLLKRGGLTPTHQHFFRRLVFWLVCLFGFAVALDVIGLSGAAAGLLAGGGLTAIVLGFAFRQIGENLLAGLFLAFSRPFQVRDLIESGEFQGRVRAIELRHTHIRTADGRDIFIPNAQIFNSPLVNYTRDGLLRPSFKIGIDYRDDAGQALALLRETAASIEHVLAEPKPDAVISTFAGGWVEIEVFFWLNVFAAGVDRTAVRSAAMEACRRALLEGGYTVSSEVSSSLAVAVTTEPSA